jgi:hypothetical protein
MGNAPSKLFTWKVIEALRLDDNGEVESSVEDM